MFGTIARRYDLLNHLLSANLDRGWRRVAASELAGAPRGRVLDLCGGTGDLALAVAVQEGVGSVICCDFAHGMLALAARKFAKSRAAGRCLALEADALDLPFPDGVFDAVTIGFGVRNLADIGAGLREVRRVLRPGGRLVVLEFAPPEGRVVSRLYRLYLNAILPRIGDGIADGRAYAYRYLARTIGEFPPPARLAERIREAGFARCTWTTRSAGIVAIHVADRA
jgi:demethylmenaquinone methyltransferase/2-methoxy-6-polyprenyl-1,4-benzoquinol methylase